MPAFRRLAGIAIAVALYAIPVLLALWLWESLEGIGGPGDCGGGCQARIAEASHRAGLHVVGAVAAAAVVVAGIVAFWAIPAPRSRSAIPEARVVDPCSDA